MIVGICYYYKGTGTAAQGGTPEISVDTKWYGNAGEMTTLMLNDFVEKIFVHERDRKGSADTKRKLM